MGEASALTEIVPVRQHVGERPRRWFSSPQLDLIVWCDCDGSPIAFQLCYDKPQAERALTWTPESGFRHEAVDDGEGHPLSNDTPILVADGHINANRVSELFGRASANLPPAIVAFVNERLRQHPNYPHLS